MDLLPQGATQTRWLASELSITQQPIQYVHISICDLVDKEYSFEEICFFLSFYPIFNFVFLVQNLFSVGYI